MFDQYNDPQPIEPFPNNTMFRISYDSSVNRLRIISNSFDDLEAIKAAFSAPNPASFFVAQYGYNIADTVYMINKFGYFQAGLFFDIVAHIKKIYGSLSCIALSKNCLAFISDTLTPLKDFFKSEDGANFTLLNISDDTKRNSELIKLGKPEFKFRGYQENALMALFKKTYGRGIIEIPTSGGKSFIISNFIYNIHAQINKGYRFLILVPNKQLVSQFFGDLKDYGLDNKLDITQFTAGLQKKNAFNPKAQVIIANRQYIHTNKDKLPKIDVLIVDEVHQASATSSASFIENLNCNIKIGCSGTLPRNNLDRWKLIGAFSKIAYTEAITDLQTQGFISKLKISLIKVTDTVVENDRMLLFHKNSLVKYNQNSEICDIKFDDAYNAELEYIGKHYKELYSPILETLSNLDGNTLILFDRIDFGKNMYSLALDKIQQKNNYYIDGEVDVKLREEIRANVEIITNGNIFAQTATFSTGINIKNLTNIVFFFSGKSFSRIIQSIGRTLRLHKDKDFARVFDISFNFKYSTKHLQERLQIYSESYHLKPDKIINLKI